MGYTQISHQYPCDPGAVSSPVKIRSLTHIYGRTGHTLATRYRSQSLTTQVNTGHRSRHPAQVTVKAAHKHHHTQGWSGHRYRAPGESPTRPSPAGELRLTLEGSKWMALAAAEAAPQQAIQRGTSAIRYISTRCSGHSGHIPL